MRPLRVAGADQELTEASCATEEEGAVSFYVRPDSYIDSNTGLAHVYLRQTVYGIEVADGDVNMNINVENGQILSYGSSVSVAFASAVLVLSPRTMSANGGCITCFV